VHVGDWRFAGMGVHGYLNAVPAFAAPVRALFLVSRDGLNAGNMAYLPS
jgi:hypothetical protein